VKVLTLASTQPLDFSALLLDSLEHSALALLLMLEKCNLDQAAHVEFTKVLLLFFKRHGDKMTWRGLVSMLGGWELSSPPVPSPLELTSLDSLFSVPSPYAPLRGWREHCQGGG
jgi:hypothetical protein